MAGKSLNKVMLIGNLGKDPEVRYTAGGLAIATFSLATNETRKDKDGNEQKKTEWHRIVAFGKLGEICGQYLNKGKSVYIEGSIRTNEWQDKEGNKRSTVEIVAQDMIMLGGRGEAGEGSGERPARRPDTDDIPPSEGGQEDDIPF